MKYNWVLFDLDNTLTDFDKSSHIAFEKLCSEHLDVVFTEELYASYKIYNGQMWHAFEKDEIDTEYLRWKRFDLFFEANEIAFDPHVANRYYLLEMTKAASLKRASLDVLNRLYGKVKMTIITNGLKENQRTIIQNLNLNHFFEDIIVSDEIGFSKPSSAFFDVCFDRIGREAISSSLIVGDSLGSDIEGATRYGVDSCWFNEHKKVNTTSYQPTYEITEIEQLLTYVS